MRLTDFFSADFDAEITSVVTDSKKAEKGCAFFCMKGRNHSSEYHAEEAYEKGATVIVSEKQLPFPNSVSVKNIEKTLAVFCDKFCGNPTEKLKLIGVTGTNGKTSVSHMIKHILEFSGGKAGIIGTVGNFAGEKQLAETGYTTPEPVQLYPLFSEMVKENAEFCVMEASSQALAQGRCENLNFETAVFTNLTKEHLDYHGDMNSYAKSKRRLFEQSRKCVLNLDDEYYDFFKAKCRTALTYSVKNREADLFADSIKVNDSGVSYNLVSGGVEYDVKLSMQGLFSVSNSLAAIGCCVFSGISVQKCAEALNTFSGVRGRAEVLNLDTPYKVMIDYAHTPDALEKILSSLRETAKGRVICLFGCGGNRDREKRPLMAKAAAENSDFVIITSDNPRNEKPDEIIRDIVMGFDDRNTPYKVIENRKDAIHYALSLAQAGDVVVLCGKGHETYQIIGNEKSEFDERKIVYNFINNE